MDINSQGCTLYSWKSSSHVITCYKLLQLLTAFAPYEHESISRPLQFCWLHIYDVNLPSTASQRWSIKWDLVTVEATGAQWTHRQVPETSSSWSDPCDIFIIIMLGLTLRKLSWPRRHAWVANVWLAIWTDGRYKVTSGCWNDRASNWTTRMEEKICKSWLWWKTWHGENVPNGRCGWFLTRCWWLWPGLFIDG